MTNATVGRRPDGPGYHWRRINDSDHGEPCLVYQALDGAYNVKFIDDERAHRLDDMPGDFIPLAKPVAAPEPDWSQAPPWAQWTTVDATGMRQWWGNEPPMHSTSQCMWMNGEYPGNYATGGRVELPLGVDWRTTLTKRQETRHE